MASSFITAKLVQSVMLQERFPGFRKRLVAA
jgi:hypothetical protein